MIRLTTVVVLLLLCAATVSAQRRAFDLTTPRPIAAADKVWIEELTWMEIRDTMNAGKTTALIVAGSTEQNGPYVDPDKIRFKQPQDAGKASINGQTLLPIETTIANGKKLVGIRATITVEAIKKALAK